MFDIEVTKMSSKGQIVIPQEMRVGLSKGDKFVIIKSGKELIIKPVKHIKGDFLEDLEFAKRTLKAFDDYKKGKCRELSKEDFLKELEKW
jgi:AbrB family looped-hinge helix DNA binding protein